MHKFRQSIFALFALFALFIASMALLPLVGHSQSEKKSPPDLRRRFYLTQGTYNGAQALTGCSSGYHMASLWEIYDPSNLRYDTQLGHAAADSGFGPPVDEGWVRTGGQSLDALAIAGNANCGAWTNDQAFRYGSVVSLTQGWANDTPFAVAPWFSVVRECNTARRVWCVQD